MLKNNEQIPAAMLILKAESIKSSVWMLGIEKTDRLLGPVDLCRTLLGLKETRKLSQATTLRLLQVDDLDVKQA